MPGNGTFNLTALWRALGIKNPRPNVRESIQPVIHVGNFDQLVPQHRPPTAAYGRTVAAVAGERTLMQVTSRALGGTLVQGVSHATSGPVIHLIRAPLAGLIELQPGALFSVAPMVSLVESGSTALVIGSGTNNPTILGAQGFTTGPWFTSWWIPPGLTWVLAADVINQTMVTASFTLVDLPASQAPEA